jgi:phytoene dehydrogenase-like protein
VTPRQVLALAGHKLPGRYRRSLERFRYGPGVFKVDWALSGPIPWSAPECRRAGTVHVCGTMEEVADAERAPHRGEHSDKPFVLLAQQTPFDPTRAPPGKHTAWGYCHVPHGSTVDMTSRIEAQIERFAPGFGDLILAGTR